MPFLGSKYAKIAFADRALPQTPLGSLQHSPKPPSWINGPTSKGRGREEGRVKLHPLSQIPGSAPGRTEVLNTKLELLVVVTTGAISHA